MRWPLFWGRGYAAAEVSGEVEIPEPLALGDRLVVDVDHSAEVEFALAEPPRFERAAGLVVRLLLDGLTGGTFRVEIECVEETPYQPSRIAWTRRGIRV